MQDQPKSNSEKLKYIDFIKIFSFFHKLQSEG